MPTADEIKELLDNCTWTWTTQDGVNGYEVKSKKNGNSIFLPSAGNLGFHASYAVGHGGFYWSSSLYTAGSNYARYLLLYSDEHGRKDGGRYKGFPVRPVRP